MVSNHTLRRRAILTAMATSGALTASAGLGGAQGRTKVKASSPTCGTLQLDYTGQGPTMTVTLDGAETAETTIEAGETASLSVASGDYIVEERPAGSDEHASTESHGSPVSVSACGLEVTPTCDGNPDGQTSGMMISNPTDTCIEFVWRGYKDGEHLDGNSDTLHAGEERESPLEVLYLDSNEFIAYAGSGPETCDRKETTTINGVMTPFWVDGEYDNGEDMECGDFIAGFPES